MNWTDSHVFYFCYRLTLVMPDSWFWHWQLDEWWEQPAATVVDWVTVDGQNVTTWHNHVKQLLAFYDKELLWAELKEPLRTIFNCLVLEQVPRINMVMGLVTWKFRDNYIGPEAVCIIAVFTAYASKILLTTWEGKIHNLSDNGWHSLALILRLRC